MVKKNVRRAQQLGMPYGTATNKLRKIVLFYLLQKYKENKCFRCSQTIEHVEDLSLEHKEPWEGRDTTRFWNVDNIAFSHLKCNVPHNPAGRDENGKFARSDGEVV